MNISGAAPIRLETQTHDVGIIIPPPDIRAIVVRHSNLSRRRDPRAISSPPIRFPRGNYCTRRSRGLVGGHGRRI